MHADINVYIINNLLHNLCLSTRKVKLNDYAIVRFYLFLLSTY